MVWKVTSIFKDTSIKISFRTDNTIRNELVIRTHFTKTFTSRGIYQLQRQTCDLSCIGQMFCSLVQRYKEHIRFITSSEPQYDYPPPTFSTLCMNMGPLMSLCPYYTQTTKVARNVYIHLFHLAWNLFH